jgi:hypothetical protein
LFREIKKHQKRHFFVKRFLAFKKEKYVENVHSLVKTSIFSFFTRGSSPGLDQDIFEIPPEQIHTTRVTMTIFDGHIVYQ